MIAILKSGRSSTMLSGLVSLGGILRWLTRAGTLPRIQRLCGDRRRPPSPYVLVVLVRGIEDQEAERR